MTMLTQMLKNLLVDVSLAGCSMSMMNTPVGDEVEDDRHRGDLVDHLMLQVGLLQMNLMEMSIGHLEVHEDLDDPDVDEEE